MFQKCIEGTDHLAWPGGQRADRATAAAGALGRAAQKRANLRAREASKATTYILLTFFCSGLMQAEGDYLSEK